MKLYRLVFTNEAEALSLVDQLQKSEDNPDGYTALDMRGKQGAVITPAYVDDNGTEHDAVMDDRFFATVISSIDVPELQSYITDVDYFPMRYMGEENMEIVKQQPTYSWTKTHIQQWLTDNGIEWRTSMTKSELLNLV